MFLLSSIKSVGYILVGSASYLSCYRLSKPIPKLPNISSAKDFGFFRFFFFGFVGSSRFSFTELELSSSANASLGLFPWCDYYSFDFISFEGSTTPYLFLAFSGVRCWF